MWCHGFFTLGFKVKQMKDDKADIERQVKELYYRI